MNINNIIICHKIKILSLWGDFELCVLGIDKRGFFWCSFISEIILVHHWGHIRRKLLWIHWFWTDLERLMAAFGSGIRSAFGRRMFNISICADRGILVDSCEWCFGVREIVLHKYPPLNTYFLKWTKLKQSQQRLIPMRKESKSKKSPRYFFNAS